MVNNIKLSTNKSYVHLYSVKKRLIIYLPKFTLSGINRVILLEIGVLFNNLEGTNDTSNKII